MTIDKSLKVKAGAISNRNVLTRAERIVKLKEAERWKEGQSVLGLPKVRVLKLALKKKKKAKAEEGAEGRRPCCRCGAAGCQASRWCCREACRRREAGREEVGSTAVAGCWSAFQRALPRVATIMRVKLEYGRTGSVCRAARRADRPHAAATRTPPPLPDPQASLLEVLARPIGTPPLAELAKGRKDACIVICDITRPVPNEMILRPVLEIARSGRHPAREDHDPRRDRPASAE